MSGTASERLYWNADKTELVREGDPAAAFLAAAVGDELPEGAKAPTAKQASKPENKAVTKPADK